VRSLNGEGLGLVVYTCIAGDYDELLPPATEIGVDYICFTDRMIQDSKGWKVLPLPVAASDNFLASRYVKMHPHLLFPNHAYSVYVDGNVRIKSPLSPLVLGAMDRGAIAMYRHLYRNCLYAEARECAALGYDWVWRIARQVAAYAVKGFPAEWGLFEANVIIRNNRDPHLIPLMEAWWQELTHGVRRDQLSLGFLSWQLGVPIVDLGESDPRIGQELFVLNPEHKRRLSVGHKIRGWINTFLSAIWPLKTR
jgi:hypothetical protein